MKKIGFDSQKYILLQSARIRERIENFGGKLYLEFGGKLFDDYHASRVLPGFAPDNKIRMLLELRDQAEIVIAINANDIEKNKLRGDLGITYDSDVIRLVDVFREFGLYVGSVAITQYTGQTAADLFKNRLESMGLRVYRLYRIPDYPSNVARIVSDEGYGRNEFIETTRSLVVVTAPGPGSGKMATCLSQLYHEHKRGIQAGYAKFETFPIWNLPLKHPVNLAYEAATADLNDVNMIDPFHLEAYGVTTVNYNRDIEIFPVLREIFRQIYGECPYKSPTDMGVNMVGYSIIDDETCCEASRQEILRRYYKTACAVKQGRAMPSEVQKLELLMRTLNLELTDRPTVTPALELAERTGEPAVAIELNDGRIITGKTSNLLGAAAAALLNALKELAGIPDEIKLISPSVIEPIQHLKVAHMGNRNPRLHTDEILIALTICAVTDDNAEQAMEQLSNLRNCEAHSTVILSPVDESVFSKLGINLTCEAAYQTKRLYHK
uniref:Putative 30S ribosomal protein S13 n=1 Tax=uncultured bacterium Ad_125_D08 TaxID=1489285 RepID=A0A0B4N030_9BACT|nr:putative 30S ribosomal protein S13 [uncultured bacterium Ad_125_D08]